MNRLPRVRSKVDGSDHRFVENRVGKKAGQTRTPKSWVYSQIPSLMRFMNSPTREQQSGLPAPRVPGLGVSSRADDGTARVPSTERWHIGALGSGLCTAGRRG